jgi:hypothetical protein
MSLSSGELALFRDSAAIVNMHVCLNPIVVRFSCDASWH